METINIPITEYIDLLQYKVALLQYSSKRNNYQTFLLKQKIKALLILSPEIPQKN